MGLFDRFRNSKKSYDLYGDPRLPALQGQNDLEIVNGRWSRKQVRDQVEAGLLLVTDPQDADQLRWQAEEVFRIRLTARWWIGAEKRFRDVQPLEVVRRLPTEHIAVLFPEHLPPMRRNWLKDEKN